MRIFAFDMDGTILNHNDEIIPETAVALDALRKKGDIAIIATGRPYKDVVRSLKDNINYFKYAVCNNGSYIKNINTGEVEVIASLPREIVKQMIKIGTKYKDFYALHGDVAAQRSCLGDVNDIDWSKEEYAEFYKFKDELMTSEEVLAWSKTQNNLFQSTIRHDAKTINLVLDDLKSIAEKASICVSNEIYIDANPLGISKWSGVSSVAKKHNISNENIVAFGDSGNDLKMLKEAGLGICMNNGTDDAKQVADEIIGNNDTNTIANKIKQIIKEG